MFFSIDLNSDIKSIWLGRFCIVFNKSLIEIGFYDSDKETSLFGFGYYKKHRFDK